MSGAPRSDDDQLGLGLFDGAADRLKAIYEAADRWSRRRLDCECGGAWWFKDCACQTEKR